MTSTPLSPGDSDIENFLQTNSNTSLLSLAQNYKSTCDIVPNLITNELNRLAQGSSILNQDSFNNKSGIYDLVSTIRLVDRKLDHITVRSKAKNLLIVTKIYDLEPVLDTLKLVEFVLRLTPKVQLYIQDDLLNIEEFKLKELNEASPELNIDLRVKYWSSDACTYNPARFDLIITLGGDGTILFASYLFQELIPPILSFSLGSLGFLTQFNFQYHEDVLRSIITNGYQCSIRTRFECTVMKTLNENGGDLTSQLKDRENILKTHRKLFSYSVFNDIVVDRGPNSSMAGIDLYSDNDLLTTVTADGCVIATPSGSTAYSLSAGGSLVHPEIPGILVTPICPHSLSFRPLVIPESIILRVGVPYNSRSSVWCSFDGRNRIELNRGDFLTITTGRFPIPFVKNTASKNEWFKRISDTLHWNERQRQKPLKIVK